MARASARTFREKMKPAHAAYHSKALDAGQRLPCSLLIYLPNKCPNAKYKLKVKILNLTQIYYFLGGRPPGKYGGKTSRFMATWLCLFSLCRCCRSLVFENGARMKEAGELRRKDLMRLKTGQVKVMEFERKRRSKIGMKN